MPGIVGLITRIPRQVAERQLDQMVKALLHEDFYTAGTWVDESLGVYVGWVERKDSFADGMPLRNERGDRVLVFSGEEYPEPGVVQRLKARGHAVSDSGPSYLVHLAEEEPKFPESLNGRFHGMLIDRTSGAATLFNDRFGMHRVCYHESSDAFYFAAEAKAILAVRPELRNLDPRGLGEFISCGSVLENRTIFDGIRVLPPGSAWVFRKSSLEKRNCYFDPKDWENQETLDAEKYYAELRDAYSRNLPRYFSGSQPIAMSLTGGLDTRMVMAWHKADPGTLPCFTFGSMFHENQDVRIARCIAKACGQPHQVLTAGNEFLAKFPHYAERAVYLSDGCVDVGRAPDLYLNELAREIAPVRMTGVYGGEVLRKIRAFKPEEQLPGLFTEDVGNLVRHGEATYAAIAEGHPVSFAVFKQGPWYHHGTLSIEQTQLSMRSPYLDNDFVRTVFRSPQSALASAGISTRLISDGDRSLAAIPTDQGLAAEFERRGNPLSQAFLKFQFKAEYAYDMGMPQWLARLDHSFSAFHFERLFLGRHKPFHFRVWYRDGLSQYVREMLLDSRSLSRPYLNRKKAEAIVAGHLKGNRNFTTAIHKLLTLELQHRLFLDSDCAMLRSPGGGAVRHLSHGFGVNEVSSSVRMMQ